jgi:hypothetical protein
MTDMISIRYHTDLAGKEIKLLLIKGRELFELLEMTPDAERYLAYHPELAEVLKKW